MSDPTKTVAGLGRPINADEGPWEDGGNSWRVPNGAGK